VAERAGAAGDEDGGVAQHNDLPMSV
jgi:hypothetical protein